MTITYTIDFVEIALLIYMFNKIYALIKRHIYSKAKEMLKLIRVCKIWVVIALLLRVMLNSPSFWIELFNDRIHEPEYGWDYWKGFLFNEYFFGASSP